MNTFIDLYLTQPQQMVIGIMKAISLLIKPGVYMAEVTYNKKIITEAHVFGLTVMLDLWVVVC